MEIETGPIPTLLQLLPKLLLDNYVLKVVKDPGLLIKLLLEKLGNGHLMILPIKSIRNLRNKCVHHIPISEEDNNGFLKSARSIKGWLQSEQFANCSKFDVNLGTSCCDQIITLISSKNEIAMLEIKEDNREINPNLTIHSDTLFNIRESSVLRDAIKGKSVKIITGKYKDYVGLFKAWNGTCARVNLGSEIISLSLEKRVEFNL